MREVVAVCRSTGAARTRVARVLDRYLWRIGDRTWRGPASNACLARISHDLKHRASRATAVAIHGFARSESELLLRVGSRKRFSENGLAPVAVRGKGKENAKDRNAHLSTARACLRMAAQLHDLGKSTVMFQDKLRTAIAGKETPSDALRHELVSALAWDAMVGDKSDLQIMEMAKDLQPSDVDAAMVAAAEQGRALYVASRSGSEVKLPLSFMSQSGIGAAVGLLILGHHRLPGATLTMSSFTTSEHISLTSALSDDALEVAAGTPYWHEAGWIDKFRSELKACNADAVELLSLDLYARTALMFSDHLGSASKTPGDGVGQIANSMIVDKKVVIADSLSKHVSRVTNATRAAFHAIYEARNDYPALLRDEVPGAILNPSPAAPARFAWQGRAAAAAAGLASSGEGGFFGCVLSGTGTGKTRAAPVILAAAAFNDVRPQRQSLRYTLALGLRTLATQSGKEYIQDLGFTERDVRVLVGQPPIAFDERGSGEDLIGSADHLSGLDGVEVVGAEGYIPLEGSDEEKDWLIGLTYDPDRQVPAFLQMLAGHDRGNARGAKLSKLAETPILCATIDHVIAAASPVRSHHLAAALRVITSDLVLDEIDQFSSEDLSVVTRLVNLAGIAGRRVIILSATVTGHVASTLENAYRAGWSVHARLFGLRDHVHLLCTSDVPSVEACATSAHGEDFDQLFDRVRASTVDALGSAPALRIAERIAAETATDLPNAIGKSCSAMHDRHAVEIEGFNVSVGFVKMTRVSHTADMAAALPPAGESRLRLKICLHSRFPRLHRAWIESRLKAALTRKGADPDAELRALCREWNVFERARKAGCRDIEIILICSPVIETGNDLDFDYAVLDPVSSRSIVQAAGRVNRHRAAPMSTANIAIIDRPVVCYEGQGLLAFPGVETRVPDGIDAIRLHEFGAVDRCVATLLGGRASGAIDARLILDDRNQPPLMRAERAHLDGFLGGRAGIVKWLTMPVARHCVTMSKERRFRRSVGTDVLFYLAGDDFDATVWMVDRLPGRSDPETSPASMMRREPEMVDLLFQGFHNAVIEERYGGTPPGPRQMKSDLQISWPVYDATDDIGNVVYSDGLGLRRDAGAGPFKVAPDSSDGD
ncbi:MAG: hypothetical protein V7673_06070 [Paracoccus sp. (in: a-proteobacteria)]|uniref:hypothetical protein n=1 Tax=Paracoccus sp. TaxID=267 RepID=UPI0030037E6B